jgi:hypothetical protein
VEEPGRPSRPLRSVRAAGELDERAPGRDPEPDDAVAALELAQTQRAPVELARAIEVGDGEPNRPEGRI